MLTGWDLSKHKPWLVCRHQMARLVVTLRTNLVKTYPTFLYEVGGLNGIGPSKVKLNTNKCQRFSYL
mgnify:CR=1 FL=1